MKLDRLFHVLVVMSAPVVTSCDSNDDRDERRKDPMADAGTDALTTDAPATSTPDAGALAPCFCDVQTCCDRAATPPRVLDGFECCWSTTCP